MYFLRSEPLTKYHMRVLLRETLLLDESNISRLVCILRSRLINAVDHEVIAMYVQSKQM